METIDQKELSFIIIANDTYEYAYEVNTNNSLLFDQFEKESILSADKSENSLEVLADDSTDTNDENKDTNDYFMNDDEIKKDANQVNRDQVEFDKSDVNQIEFESKINEISTDLENTENEDPKIDSDDEPKQILVISIVENQPEQEQQQQQEFLLEQASSDFLNDQKPDSSDNQLELPETKPLTLFKIRPIQRVFDRVLDTESQYYYKLLEMYEKNALDSEKKYYKRIYRRFGAKLDNDMQQVEIDQEQNEDDEEEEAEEGEEHEGELNIDDILYRKKMLDNGENFRNEIMQLIMNKIQRIETLIISSFQLLLVLSIFLIIVQFLILLNNLMKKSKNKVYQHRLIAKSTYNHKCNDNNNYTVKSKHDNFNV